MICDLLIVCFHIPGYSYGNGRIDNFMDLLILQILTKYVIRLVKNLSFCAIWLDVKQVNYKPAKNK